jgi:two-component system OmpR family response regulator
MSPNVVLRNSRLAGRTGAPLGIPNAADIGAKGLARYPPAADFSPAVVRGKFVPMKLLLVEDDPEAAAYLKRALSEAGHTVDAAASGRDGLMLAASEPYDVIVLDRLLPEIDGVAILRTIRASGVKTPVLLLTALGGIDDRVEGLEAGGDDYLVKPFAFAELLARVNALARRPPPSDVQTELNVADLKVDLLRRVVSRGGRRIDLQPREYQLLEYLARHSGRVVTRTMLLEGVWEFHFDPKTNIVETHMSRLRGKIDRGHVRELIHTVRGAGYVLREPD